MTASSVTSIALDCPTRCTTTHHLDAGRVGCLDHCSGGEYVAALLIAAAEQIERGEAL